MPTLVGFGTFADLLEEQISEKIKRRILSGDQGMPRRRDGAEGEHQRDSGRSTLQQAARKTNAPTFWAAGAGSNLRCRDHPTGKN
jgi:hypothetical protein